MHILKHSEFITISGGISESGCSKLKMLGLTAAAITLTLPAIALSGVVGPIFLSKYIGDSAYIIGPLAAIATMFFCTCAQCFAAKCIDKCCCANKTETAVTPESMA